MKQILLNYLPPADIYTPSASLSILKSFMVNNGFDTNVKYWNFLLNPVLPLAIDENEETSEVILPFISIINDIYSNDIGNSRAVELLNEKFDLNNEDSSYYDKMLEESKKQIHSIITEELSKLDFNDILLFGFTSKFHQWIPATVVSKAIKEIHPEAKIIIGGFGVKKLLLKL